MDTAQEKIDRRATVESEHNAIRDDRERQFVADTRALEDAFHEDMKVIRQNKEDALRAVGLNPDGSDPQERPTG